MLFVHHSLEFHFTFVLGAFAFFGPGSYDKNDIYSEILQPAAHGKLFFAGEAASACHAYVGFTIDPPSQLLIKI